MTHITECINNSSKDFDDITLHEDEDEGRVSKLKRIDMDAALLQASRVFRDETKSK